MSRAEKAKHHAKLYKNYRTGKKLPELAATGSGDIKVGASEGPGFIVADPNAPRFTYPDSYLTHIAARADAVIVGIVKNTFCGLTEDEDFIFSDHQLTVEEVIKDNPVAPIRFGSNITITRPGGVLRINNRTVVAVEGRFRPFDTGRRYALFLRFIPETGAYRAIADWSFELVPEGRRKGARILAPRPPWEKLESENDPNAFLNEVRQAVIATRR